MSRTRAALVLFAVSLIFYIATMCPSIYTMDCGELIMAAYKLQIAHATGYPLFCLLGKFFTIIIPLGTIAWRMNAMNALFAASALTVLFLALSEVTRKRAAALAVVVMGVSPIFWDAATSTEVHSLSALFITTGLWLYLRWRRSGDQRLLCWLAVTAGFSATNHLTSLMVFAAIFCAVICRDRTVLRNHRLMLKALILFILPLSIYLYLPIRAEASRGTIWGGIYADMGFKAHITGKMFSRLMFNNSPLQVWENFVKFLYLMTEQFPLYIAWMLPPGIIYLSRRKEKDLLLLLGIVVSLNVFYSINYEIIDIETYYIPTVISLSFLVAAGVGWMIKQTKIPGLKNATLAAMCLAMVTVTLVRLPSCSKHNKTFNSDFACNILGTIEKDALFIACGDGAFNAMLYEQVVNGKRPDVIILQRQIVRGWQKELGWTGKGYFEDVAQRSNAMHEICRRNRYSRREVRSEKLLNDVIAQTLKERPVYLGCGCGDVKTHPFVSYLKNYNVVPEGAVYRIYPHSARLELTKVIERSERVWKSYKRPGHDLDYSKCSLLEQEVPEYYSVAHVNLADLELKARMYDAAISHYQKAIAINDALTRAHNGLAIAYACKGKHREAAEHWNRVLELDPTNRTAQYAIRTLNRQERE